MLLNSQTLQHRSLPEATAANVCGHGIDNAEGQDAFDRARHYAKRECLRIVLVPRLDVKGKCC